MSFIDFSKIEDTDDFGQLSPGTYKVIVESSEYKQTKSGTGHYMAVTFACQDPHVSGRKVWENFNLQNASVQAQKIGQGQFKRFCAAIGITGALKSPDDFNRQAQGKLLWLELTTYKDDRDQTRTKVMKYISKQEAQGLQTGQNGTAPAPQRPATSGSPTLDEIPFSRME